MLLFSGIRRERDFAPLLQALEKEKRPVLVTGICTPLRQLFPGAVFCAQKGRGLILTADAEEASRMAQAMRDCFEGVYYFPPRDYLLVQMDCASRDFASRRLETLCALAEGRCQVVVTTVEAACQATLPQERLLSCLREYRVGEEISKEAFLADVLKAGYQSTHRVEAEGQFASRGDLVDLYPTGSEYPIRIEFFGDEIDAIGVFDPISQRRIENRPSLVVTPAREIALDEEELARLRQALSDAAEKSRPEEKEKRVQIRQWLSRLENGLELAEDLFLPYLRERATLMDYFSDETVFLYDLSAARESLERAEAFLVHQIRALTEEGKAPLTVEPSRLLCDFDGLSSRLSAMRTVILENFYAGKCPIPPSGIYRFDTRPLPSAHQDLEALCREGAALLSEGYRPLVLCENSMAAQTVADRLTAAGVPCELATGKEEEQKRGVVTLLSYSDPAAALVEGGFQLADSAMALLTDRDRRFTEKKRRRRTVPKNVGKKLLSYTELAVGDYVVHMGHGIGVFRGVEKMKSADGSQKDFIKIAYAGSDVLYVPCSNLDSVSKYIGPKSDSADLKLNRLGGQEWKKATTRAKNSARDIAKKLTALYAARQREKGFAFAPDTTWQKEFEEAFPYGETEGQLRATEEIKRDMESSTPMDRLLCGDVGFGKTEVALRGVFKCVMDNKQAAILVPTTILAWQHYQTLLSRFKGYPVRIEMLSRFCTKKEQKKILERLCRGEVDVLVGTHRLIQEDVVFSDLGFLVIDEEQRFGVTHKERLKEISRGVDVLTLTATPIPRTLNMALGGIRDMSLLEEAPEDRFPVQTFVLEHDESIVFEAIRRELRRGGQVFYLNNDIDKLRSLQPRLEREFPEASVAVGHGKMDKDSLSDVWKDMMDRKIDVLLCTTIIETGVDLPDANTLIVENADRFGLSQLHQIRGRVGRSHRKAYAYLTYRKGKALSEDSVKRLEAIREYTRFGSGFQIALRDLEIRGAGNLLGSEQSGHLDSIGYEMYMKLLNEAVLEEKGETVTTRTECTVEISLDAYLPEKYVPYPSERMDLYRRIASIRTPEDAADVQDEMLDRFGDLPRSARGLFSVALLRARAEELSCEKIRQVDGQVTFFFREGREDALALMGAVYASRLTLSLGGKPRVTLRLQEKRSVVEQCEEFLDHLAGFCSEACPKG